MTMHSPLKARRWWALSGSWLLGFPLPTPMTFAGARNLKHDLVVRHRHQAALVVQHPHLDQRNVLAVRQDLWPVRAQERFLPARPSFRACRPTPVGRLCSPALQACPACSGPSRPHAHCEALPSFPGSCRSGTARLSRGYCGTRRRFPGPLCRASSSAGTSAAPACRSTTPDSSRSCPSGKPQVSMIPKWELMQGHP